MLRCIKNVGKANALNFAMQRGVRGEFVMTLDADCVLHPNAIQNAVDYMIDDPRVAGVAANVRVMDTHSLLGLLQKFEYMVGYRSKKFYTMSNSEFIVGGWHQPIVILYSSRLVFIRTTSRPKISLSVCQLLRLVIKIIAWYMQLTSSP